MANTFSLLIHPCKGTQGGLKMNFFFKFWHLRGCGKLPISGKTRNQSNLRKGQSQIRQTMCFRKTFGLRRIVLISFVKPGCIIACKVSDLFAFHICNGFLKRCFLILPQHSHWVFMEYWAHKNFYKNRVILVKSISANGQGACMLASLFHDQEFDTMLA